MADANDILGSVMDLGSKFSTPFANSLIYGQDNAAEIAMEQERLKFAALNGSGPNDATGAQQAPQSVGDFLAGKPNTNNAPTVAAGGMNPMLLAGIAVAAVAAFFILRR